MYLHCKIKDKFAHLILHTLKKERYISLAGPLRILEALYTVFWFATVTQLN